MTTSQLKPTNLGNRVLTKAQLKSTTKVTKLPSEATETKEYSPIWTKKEGMQAVLVEQAEPINVKRPDGTRGKVKDQYILLKWSEKLSLILEIPETHQKDPAAWVAKMNKAGQVDLRRGWGKVFPQAEQYDF